MKLTECQAAVSSLSGIYSPEQLVAHKQKEEITEMALTMGYSH